MPELPEVETVKRTLEHKIKGQTIESAEVFMDKIIKDSHSVGDFKSVISGKKILKIARRGKYLLIYLSEDYVMVIHLRMTGQLLYNSRETEVIKHTHVIFNLANGYQLRFRDQRQFGKIILLPVSNMDKITGLRTLGVEPLEGQFTKEYLKKELKRRRTKIKSLLLDQTFIAGIGNIYADEALYRARINPERLASSLNSREIAKLHQAIKDVLTEGIKNRGTSIKDYVDGEGKSGGYQTLLEVYGKEDEPCHICGTLILRKKIGGRSSYYCAKCQKA